MGVGHLQRVQRDELTPYVPWEVYAQDHDGISYQQIGEITVPQPDPVPWMLFSNIEPIYRELALDFALRGDLAGQKFDTFYVQINGDAAGNYHWFDLKGLSSAVQGFTTVGGGACLIGSIPAALAPAGSAATGRIRFPAYTGVWWKTALAHSVAVGADADGDIQMRLVTSVWKNVAPITSLKVYSLSGNIMPDSVATLWGVGVAP